MSKFTGKVAVVAKDFTQGNVDKHGKTPIILQVIAGTSPNRNVLSGTIAEREGIVVGKAYLMQITEGESNDFGRQFVFSKLGELSTMEILTVETALGSPIVFDIDTGEVDSTSVEPQAEAVKQPSLADELP